MRKQSPHLGIGSRIAGGFLIVLALMASLTLVGLRHIADTNRYLRSIVEDNNVKSVLATTMQHAIYERILSMHALSLMTDDFDKDEEVQRLNVHGANYIAARLRFRTMPLTDEETRILDRIGELARQTREDVLAVVDLSMAGRQTEALDRIRKGAMPKQRIMTEQLTALVDLQQVRTAAATGAAEATYAEARNLMLLLAGATLLTGLGIAAIVSRWAGRQAQQLARQALYDALTGLANRSLLHERLEQAIAQARRTQTHFALGLMDLNRFKEINDTLGHEVGDELLRDVGRRLQETVRAEDTVARLGGDEFVILFQGLAESEVAQVMDKLLACLDPPFVWQGQVIDLAASMGIALFPAHGHTPSTLLRHADAAMYAAKRSGRAHAVYAA